MYLFSFSPLCFSIYSELWLPELILTSKCQQSAPIRGALGGAAKTSNPVCNGDPVISKQACAHLALTAPEHCGKATRKGKKTHFLYEL